LRLYATELARVGRVPDLQGRKPEFPHELTTTDFSIEESSEVRDALYS
jgi:hypothetical protein